LSLYYATELGQATRPRDIVLSLRWGHGFFTKRDEASGMPRDVALKARYCLHVFS
jgi:hypothetical protein